MTVLIFPHQLYQDHPGLAQANTVVLVEDPLFFTELRFHKKKLIFHRASMQTYAAELTQLGFDVRYVEFHQLKRTEDIRRHVSGPVIVADVVDDWLEQRLNKTLQISWQESPGFFLKRDELRNSKFFPFYCQMRRKLDVLMEEDGPLGGSWTYDTDNRKKWPKGRPLPCFPKIKPGDYVLEATDYVEKHFPENPGTSSDFSYAVERSGAKQVLQRFVGENLAAFGPFQDAMRTEDSPLEHSVLSPYLNAGLITPHEVLKAALCREGIPLPSLEGFVRQVMGWREFVRMKYCLCGRRMRSKNFWRHTRSLSPGFWTAQTGIEPLDICIEKLLHRGWLGHIERLMLFSNFMLLTRTCPDGAYRWFMELFVDAYDWVMVPNVYGMGLHADGGEMMTKPYISASNYIRKMSNFKLGTWCTAWDGLYWRFIQEERAFFETQPRLSMMVRMLDKMSEEKRSWHFREAKKWLERE